jgi:soluble lytic murein transglycosylase
MSNCAPVEVARICLVGALCWATSVAAQSPATLEAVRLHRDSALSSAQEELATCLSGSGASAADGGSEAADARATAPCAAKLSLLVGYLALSSGDAQGAAKQLSAVAAPPGLAPVHGYYLAEALFYSREFARSAKVFDRAQKNAPPWLAARLRPRVGEA